MKYIFEEDGVFHPPYKGTAKITCIGAGGTSSGIILYRTLKNGENLLKGFISSDGEDGEVVVKEVELEEKDYPIIVGKATQNPEATIMHYDYFTLDGFMADGVHTAKLGDDGGSTLAFGVTAKGGNKGISKVTREKGETFSYYSTDYQSKENGGKAMVINSLETSIIMENPKNGKVIIEFKEV